MTVPAGMEKKFTMIKNDDIEKLGHHAKVALGHVVEEVNELRKQEGKKENTYLVINTDEPYADEVIAILKRNGHWGATNNAEPKAINFYKTSNMTLEINEMICGYCEQIFYEFEDHELEHCPHCDKEFDYQPSINEYDADTYTLIVDHKTGVPIVIRNDEYYAITKPAKKECAFCHSEISTNEKYEHLDDGDICCIPCFLTESDTGE